MVWLLAVLLLTGAWPARAQSGMVIHKEGTKQYHRPGCPVIRDFKGVLAMTEAQARARGYTQHEACEDAEGGGEGKGKDGAPAAVTVYLDGSKYYHRETCARVGDAKMKPASLDAVARKHWPCPTCKPPIRKRAAEPAVPGRVRRGS